MGLTAIPLESATKENLHVENPMKEYKIEITRIEDVTHAAGVKSSYENTHRKDEKGENIWESVPKAEHTERVKTTVFAQTVESIDMLAIVAAINRVEFK